MSGLARKRVKFDRTRPAHNKACARCRMKKTKCGGLWPACSSCKSAAVSCLGYDTSLSTEVPRSIATYLEEKVISLEMEVDAWREQDQYQASLSRTEGIMNQSNVHLRNMLTTAMTSVMDSNQVESGDMFLYHTSSHRKPSLNIGVIAFVP